MRAAVAGLIIALLAAGCGEEPAPGHIVVYAYEDTREERIEELFAEFTADRRDVYVHRAASEDGAVTVDRGDDLVAGSDEDVEASIAKQRQFDSDLWVIEVEDRQGRHLLDEPGLD